MKKAKGNLHNLPSPISSFIGREREIAQVKQLLLDHRLVTLTGPGGAGKTRLALQTARELQGEYEDGIWLVELASLSDSALVTQTIASHLNVREQSGRPLIDTLADHLFSNEALLVMDNCEHIIAACAQFAETILQRCPDLRILATSREMLGISGESVLATPPLTLPEEQPWKSPASANEALKVYGQSEAVQLFVDRAASMVQGFALNTENGAWVSEICRRLDGMPLAIELAAARVQSMSVRQIVQRLDDRFHLLTGGSRTAPPRQQTLESTIAWSYALLSPSEQKVLQRLSVFAGGASLDAIESVCVGGAVDPSEILDIVSQLMNKSLVVVDRTEGGETRYHLLETIRQYALEKLAESGEGDESRNRHLHYFVRWAQQVEPWLARAEALDWLSRFEAEHDNIRAALMWSRTAENGAVEGLQLAAIAAIFWKLHGYHSEGRMWLTAALAQKTAQSPTLVRAQALFHASLLAFYQSDYPAVRALAEESLTISRKFGVSGRLEVANALEILAEVASETGDYSAAPDLYEQALSLYREVGDLVGIGDTLKMMGWTAMRAGDFEQAEARLEEALIVCRQAGDLHQIVSALSGLGELAVRQTRYARARSLLQESLDLNRRVGEKWGLAIALGTLGWIALRQHEFNEMRKLLRESLEIRVETGDRGGIAWCLEKLAEANGEQSHFQVAVTIFGAASALRAPVGSAMDAADRPGYERIISMLKVALGEEAFAAAWSYGQAMNPEQAIEYALAEPESAKIETSPKEKFGGLTAREREVAAWIMQGKSNREIAKAMTVSEKTIETYVTRILNKLGFDSRVQIATWMMEKDSEKRSYHEPE